MKFSYSLVAAFVSTFLFAHSLQAQELPKAPNAEVFALTPEPGYFTEPGVAVNPSDPKQVVAVFQDNAHVVPNLECVFRFPVVLRSSWICTCVPARKNRKAITLYAKWESIITMLTERANTAIEHAAPNREILRNK